MILSSCSAEIIVRKKEYMKFLTRGGSTSRDIKLDSLQLELAMIYAACLYARTHE